MFETMITDTVQNIVKEYITDNDIVIDATMGNGNDTMFLADQVGENGNVYAFDIQKKAIETTKDKLNERNLLNRVTLIEDSHENIKKYVEKPIQVAMFNLGYLPTGNKEIITRPKSTLKAIASILDLLKSNGIISIISYYGHEGGLLEKNTVCEYLGKLSNKEYDVISIGYENRKKNAPIIYLVRKK